MQLELVKAIFLGLIGGVSAYAVNRNMAVYHDGLRSVMPELVRGEKTRLEISKYSFDISIGFILLYALPYTLATGIIVIHIILLSIDIIATRLSKTIWAVLCGFFLGVGFSLITGLFYQFLVSLPVDVLQAINITFLPLAYTFPLLPAIAVGYRYGWKPAVTIGVLTMGSWLALSASLPAGLFVGLTVRGLALLVGMIALIIYFGYKEKKVMDADEQMFAENISAIRSYTPILLFIGGLLTVAASQHWVAGEPIQLMLLQLGLSKEAALASFFSALGFLPLVALSGLVSGVWNQDGYCDWLLGIGYLLPNPLLAFFGGVVGMGIEMLTLKKVSTFLQSWPGMSSAASAMRDSMNIIPELAVLAGGVAAGVMLAGPLGAVFVIGVYALNEISHRPAMPMAVPPAAVLVLGLILNFIHLTNLPSILMANIAAHVAIFQL